MNRIVLLCTVAFVTACGPSPDASAACSGSGLTWACAAGTTIAEVNTALTSATDGATLTFAVGSYTWDSSFIALQNTKGVTLICAVEHGCDVSPGTNGFLRHQTLNGVNTKFYRFSGFYVHGGTCSLNCIHFFPVFGASADTEMTQFRIDHNRFEDLANGGQLMTFGEITRPSKWSGSIDHNIITNSTGSNRFQFFGTLDSSTVTPAMSQVGSGSCVYFENNTVNYTNPTNNGLAWIDGQATACYIIRDNSLTNARVVSHGTVFNWGITRMEVYRNTFIRDKATADGLGDCHRSIHMQGSGTGVVWGNTFSCFLTMSPGTIQLLHYRDATPASAGYSAGIGQCDGLSANDGNTSPEATHRGYPCRHQPGRAARLGVPLASPPVQAGAGMDTRDA